MCYISGMSTTKFKKILTCFPWIIVMISVAVLGLYEAGLITFEKKHKSPLTEVEFILPLIPLEDVTYSQNMLLVNNEHPLPEEFSPDIVFYRDTDVPMNSAAAGVNALAIMSVSDNFVTGAKSTAEERETSFTNMMKLALETAVR